MVNHITLKSFGLFDSKEQTTKLCDIKSSLFKKKKKMKTNYKTLKKLTFWFQGTKLNSITLKAQNFLGTKQSIRAFPLLQLESLMQTQL